MHIDHRAATHIQNERLRAAMRRRTRRDDTVTRATTQSRARPGVRGVFLRAVRGIGAVATAAVAPWSTRRRHA